VAREELKRASELNRPASAKSCGAASLIKSEKPVLQTKPKQKSTIKHKKDE
jgi:hypothetical protein